MKKKTYSICALETDLIYLIAQVTHLFSCKTILLYSSGWVKKIRYMYGTFSAYSFLDRHSLNSGTVKMRQEALTCKDLCDTLTPSLLYGKRE